MTNITRRFLLALVAAFAVAGLALTPALARDEGKGPLVFAAASLKDALDNINAAWAKDGKPKAAISYAASSVLAKQIESAHRQTSSSPPTSIGWTISPRRASSSQTPVSTCSATGSC